MNNNILCGILAFQGNVAEHEQALRRLGVASKRVISAEDLLDLTHLIIPGGESTVMSSFFKKSNISGAIQERARANTLKIFGTCAGAILLSQTVISEQPIENLQLIDITISRNAYGSQLHSFENAVKFKPTNEMMNAVFIRAPKITNVGDAVTVLVEHRSQPVLVQQGNVLASTFHPEYLNSPIVHQYFLQSV